MGHWFDRNIVEPGKLPLLLAPAAFVLTFAVTRVVTRMIRAGKGPFRNITPGGLHVHHGVPGVVLSIVGAGGTGPAPGRCCCAPTTTTCAGRGRAADFRTSSAARRTGSRPADGATPECGGPRHAPDAGAGRP